MHCCLQQDEVCAKIYQQTRFAFTHKKGRLRYRITGRDSISAGSYGGTTFWVRSAANNIDLLMRRHEHQQSALDNCTCHTRYPVKKKWHCLQGRWCFDTKSELDIKDTCPSDCACLPESSTIQDYRMIAERNIRSFSKLKSTHVHMDIVSGEAVRH